MIIISFLNCAASLSTRTMMGKRDSIQLYANLEVKKGVSRFWLGLFLKFQKFQLTLRMSDTGVFMKK